MEKKKKAKKKLLKDPYAEREAQRYVHPIPSREFILSYLRKRGKPVRYEDLSTALQLTDAEAGDALRKRLRAMERDGQIIRTRREGYGLPEKMNLVRGRVIGHKEGYGFVVPDDGSEDLFLNARHMRLVFHGDRVLVHVIGMDRKGRREAAIVEILERGTSNLVGRFFVDANIAYVVPHNKRICQDILVPVDQRYGAQAGQIVVVEITAFPSFHQQAVGKVIEILGDHMAKGMEIDMAIRNFNIPHKWPDKIAEETVGLTAEVCEQDKKGRLDLRQLPFVTIDGEDAKDFDDAVYCRKLEKGKGWQLYVAIADVSYYVKPETTLDQEAAARGNSVYFPEKVIPMLPEIISNGLCSLNPAVDRLAIVCDMAISNNGNLSRYSFYPAVIQSRARLTYTEVAAWLDTEAKLKSVKYSSELQTLFTDLKNLFEILYADRDQRGAIDFDTVETKIIFGTNHRIEQIVPAQRTIAHRIIEECMLMANVAAARFLLKQKIPTVFRVHAGPPAEKLQMLRDFLAGLGLQLSGGTKPEPIDYATLLHKIIGRPDAHLIQTILLRSLSQAIYSPNNVGHFGLAFSAYVHFTSPIRRYPDLLIHRAIRFALQNNKKHIYPYEETQLTHYAEHCSMTERRADEAVREAVDWLKCEYMKDHVGAEFEGIISNVTAFGLFIELKDIYVEGLLHVTALKNDYYHFDPIRHKLRGERTGKIYCLGDLLQVRVIRVDLEERQIDFGLAEGVKKTTAFAKIKKR